MEVNELDSSRYKFCHVLIRDEILRVVLPWHPASRHPGFLLEDYRLVLVRYAAMHHRTIPESSQSVK